MSTSNWRPLGVLTASVTNVAILWCVARGQWSSTLVSCAADISALRMDVIRRLVYGVHGAVYQKMGQLSSMQIKQDLWSGGPEVPGSIPAADTF
jgi:hypothetical protein